MVQHRASRYTCNIYHNTNSLSTLEKRRIFYLYKIIHHFVAIYPTNLLTQSVPKTRQYPHNYFYRLNNHERLKQVLIFNKNNSTMEPATLDSFREQIPISVDNNDKKRSKILKLEQHEPHRKTRG